MSPKISEKAYCNSNNVTNVTKFCNTRFVEMLKVLKQNRDRGDR